MSLEYGNFICYNGVEKLATIWQKCDFFNLRYKLLHSSSNSIQNMFNFIYRGILTSLVLHSLVIPNFKTVSLPKRQELKYSKSRFSKPITISNLTRLINHAIGVNEIIFSIKQWIVPIVQTPYNSSNLMKMNDQIGISKDNLLLWVSICSRCWRPSWQFHFVCHSSKQIDCL